MRKIKFIVGFCLLVTGTNTLFAQGNLYVRLKTNTESQYALTDIQNITFSSASMLIKETNGNNVSFPAGTLRYLNFVSLATGIRDKASNKSVDITLYPNPLVENKLTITYELTEPGSVLIEILDLKGVLLKQITEKGNVGNNEARLELQGVASGVYTCHISTDSQTGIKKLIKQ